MTEDGGQKTEFQIADLGTRELENEKIGELVHLKTNSLIDLFSNWRIASELWADLNRFEDLYDFYDFCAFTIFTIFTIWTVWKPLFNALR